MPLVILCPSCKTKLKVPDAMVGKKVKCPSCQSAILAKDPGGAPAPVSHEAVRSKAAPREEEVYDDLEVEDRPPAKRRDADAYADRPARGRRDDDYDDDDDRPSRSRRDDDYEDDRPRKKPKARSGGSSESDRSTAMLMWLLSLLGVGIVTLILWLTKRKESRYIDHHGKMWLNVVLTAMFEVFGLMILVVLAIVGGTTLHYSVGIVFGVLAGILYFLLIIWSVVVQIMGIIKGKNGEWWYPPMTWKLLK